MRAHSELLDTFLKLISIVLFTVSIESQKVLSEVTGYVGQVVNLPCQSDQEQKDESVVQFEWDFQPSNGNKTTLIVSNVEYGINIPESPLKNRLELSGQSLTIKDVEMKDAGLFTCSITSFPSGSFKGETKLSVQENKPISSGVIIALIIAVMLLLGIVAATVYFIFIRYSYVRRLPFIGKNKGAAGQAAAQPTAPRDPDVVYSAVKAKHSRHAPLSFSHKHTEDVHVADVTYADVVVVRQQR